MTSERARTNEPTKPTEIERKFTVNVSAIRELQLDGYPHERIDQGYLSNTPQSATRVRRKGVRFFLTHKAAPTSNVAERVELETELSEDQFLAMWPGTEGRRLEKTRYRIPIADSTLVIELDVFHGDNEGQMLAEVEFPSTAESDAFVPLKWFSADVTADPAYGNSNIAEHGFPGN